MSGNNFGRYPNQLAATPNVDPALPQPGLLHEVASLAGHVATAVFGQFSPRTVMAVESAGSDRRGPQPNPTTVDVTHWVNTNHRT